MDNLVLDYTNALAEAVGDEHGVTAAELEAVAQAAPAIHADLQRRRQEKEIGFYDLPYQNLTKVISASCALSQLENVVVLGIGGSSLGSRALAKALLPPAHELLSVKDRGGRPRLLVADNIDPDQFLGLLAAIDLDKSVFIVISKSGGTAETMSQFLIVRDLLIQKFGTDGYRERMIAITDQETGLLRQIVDQDQLAWHVVPANVGGRYSVFTPVGLLPAALCGVDVLALLKGAAALDRRILEADFRDNPAYLLGALLYLADAKHKKNIIVMMPYSSRLLDFSEWFQQLWAESLGKAAHLDGSPAHVCATPVRALGATDQHSQLQLYMEGPNDKLVVFLKVNDFDQAGKVPKAFDDIEGVSYLGGHTLAELINAEQLATEMALTKFGRPNIRIDFPAVSSFALGQAMYLMEVATVFAGGLYKVNPLDQPGVEVGKRYTMSMMGRKGYEKEAREVLSYSTQTVRAKV